MDANEIMTNEEVVETVTEELAVARGSCKGIKVAAGIGIVLVCGIIVYKFAAKPMLAKLKAKNTEANIIEVEAEPTGEEIDDEESEEA